MMGIDNPCATDSSTPRTSPAIDRRRGAGGAGSRSERGPTSIPPSGGWRSRPATIAGTRTKRRQAHPHDAAALPETAREFIDHTVVGAKLPGTWELSLTPTLTTTYRRRTLLLPGSASRVTVDTDLRWATADGNHIDLPGVAIVETKTATTRPCLTDRLLWRAGHRPSLISKYGTGLAALRPDLPSNKWHRVLNHYFWSAP